MFKSEEHKTTPRKTEGVIRRTVPSPAREAIKPSPVGEGGPLAVDEANELQQIKIEANNLPPLGRDALRKLHGVEFSAKAVKQSMIANRTGDRARGSPTRT